MSPALVFFCFFGRHSEGVVLGDVNVLGSDL